MSYARVTFVLPRAGRVPAGGFRVVYEYANRLARLGHTVSVIHPGRLSVDSRPLDPLWNTLRHVQRSLDGSYRPDQWFKIDPEVDVIGVTSLSERNIPAGDIVVATAWQTAEWVNSYSATRGRKLYLIQGLETWNGPRDRVMNTWTLPLRKIVIATWLQKTAHSMGEAATFIPNGLDTSCLQVRVASPDRRDKNLAFLWHASPQKGSYDVLAAIEHVRTRYPDLSVSAFGVGPRRGLPSWVHYDRLPSLDRLRCIYNDASIFVTASHTEGWGLTACEAMLCGAAVVATDIEGHKEFATDGVTALLSPRSNPVALSERIERLIEDGQLRFDMAAAARKHLLQFTWERAVRAFDRVIQDELACERQK